MKIVSIISMVALTLSVWGLFFAITIVDQSPSEYEVNAGLDEDRMAERERDANDYQPVVLDEENSDDNDVSEAVSENSDEEIEEDEPVVDEEVSLSVEERASSPYNDILYDFERSNPVSIDELLSALDIE
ncbi:hypothetical protein SAMN05421734_10349 [Pelagirhabdus alkalitolerans]|uniref:Uncharacterized protein n=1 Tax=Pelagirhabdus alkalitolerans TaxID=1612202 RepID=A0A1G6HJL1_9BACI|nr:hypothetical protein [Pelagirhabdus alkalitolerans]SDB94288.1 hypothetical protein SAMN05421734_10349 [Pelagirhabdus alkalitolerans]